MEADSRRSSPSKAGSEVGSGLGPSVSRVGASTVVSNGDAVDRAMSISAMASGSNPDGGALSSILSGAASFLCRRCNWRKPLVEMSKTRKDECIRDGASYKSIADRWSKQRQLKTWFDNQSPEERITWYRKQQETAKGDKRKFDNVDYEDKTSAIAYERAQREEMMIPFSEFELPLLIKGYQTPRLWQCG